MRKCLKFELIKFINMKILLIFLLFQALWTSIIAWSIFYSMNGEIIDNFIAIRTLVINGNFHMPILTSLFIGSIFSIEYENNIEFALKLYKNEHMERYIFKTVIYIIYIVISYFIQFLVTFIVQNNISVNSRDIFL